MGNGVDKLLQISVWMALLIPYRYHTGHLDLSVIGVNTASQVVLYIVEAFIEHRACTPPPRMMS